MAGVIEVRERAFDDLAEAVGIISRGMRDNPLHIAALGPEADRRVERLRQIFTVVLPMIVNKGVLLGAVDDAALVGVAGVAPPGKCQLSVTERLTLLPRMLPALGFRAFGRVGQWLSAWGSRDLTEPHVHLGPVAVDAHLQGRGIGRLLMTEYCARLDRMHAVGYLETDKPINISFYEKFGFQTIGDARVLDTTNWFMRRPASAQQSHRSGALLRQETGDGTVRGLPGHDQALRNLERLVSGLLA